ncbi:unnamed protein product [Spirodela intermedia]|uniref:Uncharacterized protein n=1 Tax=Spirodela intermedia TaxID=51605 RepID=A0A7I8KYU3_SPIIN|nr:unnamed protein product [Spirodela intermedia]
MSRGIEEEGRGRMSIKSGKLRSALRPLRQRAPTSYARAAISAVGKEPSQILDFFRGSLISDTHFPHRRFLTPRYTGCRVPAPVDAGAATFDFDESSAGDSDTFSSSMTPLDPELPHFPPLFFPSAL